MTKLKLTQAIVDKTQPQNKAIIYWDQSITGFGLKVTPTGMKSYILQTRIAGREYKKTIYKADFIKLEQARNQARSLLGKIAMGENPFDETIREMNTFAKLSEAYIEEHAKKKKKPKSAEGDRALLRNHILPTFEKCDPEKITRAEITRFRTAVAKGDTAKLAIKLGICNDNRLKGGEICANRCLALLSVIFSFAERESYITRLDNPVRKVEKCLAPLLCATDFRFLY